VITHMCTSTHVMSQINPVPICSSIMCPRSCSRGVCGSGEGSRRLRGTRGTFSKKSRFSLTLAALSLSHFETGRQAEGSSYEGSSYEGSSYEGSSYEGSSYRATCHHHPASQASNHKSTQMPKNKGLSPKAGDRPAPEGAFVDEAAGVAFVHDPVAVAI